MPAPISVVIPCYRCAGTIERAVASIARQTLLPREVILVDDASGDGGETLAALERLRRTHASAFEVKVLSLAVNAGPGGARNAGWDAATQPYVAFLDADDAWHPRKLALQHACMESHLDATLTGHSFAIRAETDPEPSIPAALEPRPVGLPALLLLNCFPTPSVMLRREIGLRFESTKRESEDYLLWLRIVAGGGRALRLDAPLVSLFKADFGGGGLSGNLWKMESGELDTYRRLRADRVLSLPSYAALTLLSLVKFVRRIALRRARRLVAWRPRRPS